MTRSIDALIKRWWNKTQQKINNKTRKQSVYSMYSSSFFSKTNDRPSRLNEEEEVEGEGRSIGDFRTPTAFILIRFRAIVVAILLLYVILLVALRTRILGHAWNVLERTISREQRSHGVLFLQFIFYFLSESWQHLHPRIYVFFFFFTIFLRYSG